MPSPAAVDSIAPNKQLPQVESELALRSAPNNGSGEHVRLLEEEVSTRPARLGDSAHRPRASETLIPELSAQIEQLLGIAEQQTQELLSAARRDAVSEAARAEADATATRREAAEAAEGLLSEARQKADAILKQARVSADRLVVEARKEAELLRLTAEREADDLARKRDAIQRLLLQLHELQEVLAGPDTTLADLVAERLRARTAANGHHPTSPS